MHISIASRRMACCDIRCRTAARASSAVGRVSRRSCARTSRAARIKAMVLNTGSVRCDCAAKATVCASMPIARSSATNSIGNTGRTALHGGWEPGTHCFGAAGRTGGSPTLRCACGPTAHSATAPLCSTGPQACRVHGIDRVDEPKGRRERWRHQEMSWRRIASVGNSPHRCPSGLYQT